MLLITTAKLDVYLKVLTDLGLNLKQVAKYIKKPALRFPQGFFMIISFKPLFMQAGLFDIDFHVVNVFVKKCGLK